MDTHTLSNMLFDVEKLLEDVVKLKKEHTLRKAVHVSLRSIYQVRRELETETLNNVKG